MQKQKKQMFFVLLLCILVLAAYFGLKSYNQKQEEEQSVKEEAEKIKVTDFSAEDITAFSYQYENGTYSFVKEENWKCMEEPELTLDESVITTMLSDVGNLEAANQIETDGELSEYGFDSPQNVLTFTTENGTTTLTLGMENAVTGQYYVRKNEESVLYLVETNLASVFEKSLDALEKEETEAETETEDETEE